jgi:basic amino acid/polyamine antiporter, APA family
MFLSTSQRITRVTNTDGRLKRQLKLFDVFVLSTGAMMSGFFLLPGVAASETGSSVILAYLISGILILPALLSYAELSTAMPRAGGTYYYLDRTLGPLVGTAGGVGTWLTLILKSAFGLIGMGAYLALVLNVDVRPIALGCTVLLGLLNIFGARGSSGLTRVLVLTLVLILMVFVGHALFQVGSGGLAPAAFDPFLRADVDGLLGTVGLIFVSYIGLTKVASLAEEVENPDRNFPLGMVLGLATVTVIYVVGVFVMVAVLGVDSLAASLTPVADTAMALSNWIPSDVWVWLVVVAAVAAFASMSNAGILAASRYPLAMARDRLIPEAFAAVGSFQTPVRSIVITCVMIAAALLVLDVEKVAKLASALQLAVFGMVNVSVIVMRESQIEAYDPGFRSPLYPWVQLLGIIVPIMLVAEMGWLSVLFTLGVIGLGIAWFQYYARARIEREGAIFHVFARLGRRRFAGLDRELRDIMKEKGLRAEDPFDEVVARAVVLDYGEQVDMGVVISEAARLLSERLPTTAEALDRGFCLGVTMGGAPVARGAALVHTRLPDLESSEMVLVRCGRSVNLDLGDNSIVRQAAEMPIHAIFLLVSGERDPGQHLRILAQLAGRIEDAGFINEWLEGRDDQELKETLLRDDRFLALKLRSGTKAEVMIGKALRELSMPEGSLVALIRRYGVTVVPRGRTVLREGDRLTIIGDPVGLRELAHRYLDQA